MAASVSGLLYFWFFPPLELKVTYAEFPPLGSSGCYYLTYTVTYVNHGIYDLTVSGEINTAVTGYMMPKEEPVLQPQFLLRAGESIPWTISELLWCKLDSTPASGPIHLEATAFLTVNGMQRTYTATYQVTAP